MIITPEDESLLRQRGLTTADLFGQIELFTKGLQPLRLEKPCSVGDGIIQLGSSESNRLVQYYDAHEQGLSIQALVPASGAATRMFKHLHHYNPDNENDLTEEFILHFKRFPFIDELSVAMSRNGISLEETVSADKWGLIFDYILSVKGLNYDDQLKGMVLFHKYDDAVRTAFEEHLHEFLKYGRQSDGKWRIHLTLAPQHLELVSSFMEKKIGEFQYEEIELSYSTQSPSTDTIALDKDNQPIRDSEGKLLFRPGGHGALIHNLQQLDADVIFIKNIDNIAKQTQVAETIFNKKMIGGLLLEIKREVNHFLNKLESGESDILEDALEFIHQWFQPGLPLGHSNEQLIQYAKLRLDRPLRICGMVTVKNLRNGAQ